MYSVFKVIVLRLQFSAIEEGVDVTGLISETRRSLLIHYVAVLNVQIIRQQQLKLTIKNTLSLIINKIQNSIISETSHFILVLMQAPDKAHPRDVISLFTQLQQKVAATGQFIDTVIFHCWMCPMLYWTDSLLSRVGTWSHIRTVCDVSCGKC